MCWLIMREWRITRVKVLEEGITIARRDEVLMGIEYRGRNYTIPALDVDLDEARHCFETNVFAVMAMCQVFTPLLIKRKGLIVNIGSLAAVRIIPSFSSNLSKYVRSYINLGQYTNDHPSRSSPMSSAAFTMHPKQHSTPIPAPSVSNSLPIPYASWS